MTRRVMQTNELCRSIIEDGPTLENLKLLKRHVSSLNSYMGFCVHQYTFNRRKRIFSNVPYFWKCCNIQRRFTVVKVKKKHNYESFLLKTDQHDHENSIRHLAPLGKRKKGTRAKHLHRGV